LKAGRIDLPALMEQLGSMDITSLLIEGGGTVSVQPLRRHRGQDLFLLRAKILGGDDGVPICRGVGPESMGESIPIHDLSVLRFDADVMLQGYLKPR
jgi:diaminohydroxyphosphoribosylaminopyrimidine deaminase/5-amino-6-(5-phosphoribosylamino)uracil reductase